MTDLWGWTQTAERVWTGSDFLLGEDESGYLYVPSLRRAQWWQTRFSWRKPWHWPVYAVSRVRRRLAWLEAP